MPAVSESQRKLFCLALSIKKGKTAPNVSAEASKIVNTMTLKEIEKYCKEPVKK